jgi:hypothetical protein
MPWDVRHFGVVRPLSMPTAAAVGFLRHHGSSCYAALGRREIDSQDWLSHVACCPWRWCWAASIFSLICRVFPYSCLLLAE